MLKQMIYQESNLCNLKFGRPPIPKVKILVGTLEELTLKIDKET